MRILLVDDDQKLNNLVSEMLKQDHHICSYAITIEAAEEKLETDSFDLILLDVMLPDGDGISFCKTLRSRDIETPILMLTSKGSTVDKVSGLVAGADDYLPKPFSPNELRARVRALLRRPQTTLSEQLECGEITLNTTSHSVMHAGTKLDLMPKEYSLLEYLLRKKNAVVKKEELLRHVWGVYSRTSSNRLEVYIRYLREKIDIPYGTNLIQTVRGMGYKIADE
jgi:DNA-binding response OmpR family regulator